MRGFGQGAQRRTARFGYFARVLALVALCLQLAAPAIDVRSLLPAAEQTALGGLFEPQLICHAGDADQAPRPEAPGQPSHHSDHVACCPWHGNAGPLVQTPTRVEPAALAYAVVSFPAPASIPIAARHPGGVRARSPPAQA